MKKEWSFFILYLLILYFYIHTASPSIGPEDSGEFSTAITTLGIPHPPGYPAYTLLGKCFITSIPWASAAYISNILSGILTVISLIFIFGIFCIISNIMKLQHKNQLVVYILCAINIGFLSPFWNISTTAEVITLNLLMFCVLVFLCLTMQIEHHTILRNMYLFSFLFGLFLGNHYTLILLIPAVFYLLRKKIINCFSFGFFIKTAAFFMLGFSIYVFLYIRSHNNPYLDIGDTETFRNFFNHLLRRSYGGPRLGPGSHYLFTLSEIFKPLLYLVKDIYIHYTIIELIVGLTGFVLLYRKNKHITYFILLSFLFLGPFFVIIAHADFDPLSQKVLERLLLPAYVSFYLFFFAGIMLLFAELQKRTSSVRAQWLIIILLSCISVKHCIDNFPQENTRHHFYAYFYGKDILRTVISPGILFSAGDTPINAVIYLQQIEHHRNDVLFLYPAQSTWFIHQMKNRYPEIFKILGEEKGVHLAQKIASSYRDIFNIYSTHKFIFPESHDIGLMYVQSHVSPVIAEKYPPLNFIRYMFYQKHPFPEEPDPFIQEIIMQYPRLIPRMDLNLSKKNDLNKSVEINHQ